MNFKEYKTIICRQRVKHRTVLQSDHVWARPRYVVVSIVVFTYYYYIFLYLAHTFCFMPILFNVHNERAVALLLFANIKNVNTRVKPT